MIPTAAFLPPLLEGVALPANSPSDQIAMDLSIRCAMSDLRERLHHDDRDKWDLTVRREHLLLDKGQLVLPKVYLDEYPERLILTPWATAQACQRLGIPGPYFARCPVALQDAQFNHWAWKLMEEDDELEGDDPLEDDSHASPARPTAHQRQHPWLLRAKGHTVRAVLSDRYAPLDNADLVSTLTPLLEGRFEIKTLALTPESLHLRLVDPKLAREVIPNDRLLVGLHIANSEVGRRSVSVDALVYRLVCQNGLIRLVRGKSLLRQRHVSWERPRFADALSRALSDAITEGAGLIERLAWAARLPIPDVEGTLRTVARQANLSQSVQEGIRQALLASPPSQQENLYGFVQALTFTAQRLSADDRYDLEVLAGRLLDGDLPSAGRAASFGFALPGPR